MATGKLLRRLIKAGAHGDEKAFLDISAEVIKHERQKQHHLLANDLERILYGEKSQSSPTLRLIREVVPTDEERGLELLDVREPCRDLDDVVLSDENNVLIERVLYEQRREDILASYGLRPVQKILMCGPPGCGKTLTAEVIATELSRPLVIVRLDSVVSSYLGETSANLRKVFDFISNTPVVALFDEFDALGKERSDTSEHGELRRVVNALLQLIDGYRGKSLLLAATNHEGSLDRAIWRRFEEVLVFNLPNSKQISALLTLKLRGARREFDIEDIPIKAWFGGFSFADVERVVLRAIKTMALESQEFLKLGDLEKALAGERARHQRIAEISERSFLER